jgi:hypothetical protein
MDRPCSNPASHAQLSLLYVGYWREIDGKYQKERLSEIVTFFQRNWPAFHPLTRQDDPVVAIEW